jgi:hypothetical protein
VEEETANEREWARILKRQGSEGLECVRVDRVRLGGARELELRERGVFVGLGKMRVCGAAPFFRSRLFWLGVPGLVFLLWVWWDSGGYASHASWQSGREIRQVEVDRGCVVWMTTVDLRSAVPVPVEPFHAGRYELKEEDGRHFDFAPPFKRKTDDLKLSIAWMDMELHSSRLALWVVVAVYVAMWIAMAFAWQRRKARVVKCLTEVEVAS